MTATSQPPEAQEPEELMQFTCGRCGKFMERSLPTMMDAQECCWDCASKQFWGQGQEPVVDEHLHEWDLAEHFNHPIVTPNPQNCEVCTVPSCGSFRCEVE